MFPAVHDGAAQVCWISLAKSGAAESYQGRLGRYGKPRRRLLADRDSPAVACLPDGRSDYRPGLPLNIPRSSEKVTGKTKLATMATADASVSRKLLLHIDTAVAGWNFKASYSKQPKPTAWLLAGEANRKAVASSDKELAAAAASPGPALTLLPQRYSKAYTLDVLVCTLPSRVYACSVIDFSWSASAGDPLHSTLRGLSQYWPLDLAGKLASKDRTAGIQVPKSTSGCCSESSLPVASRILS